YAQWGGGHGIGSALFWDLVKDKSISGFDPANVVTVMTSPLTGTMALGAGARTEVQGIGVQQYPTGWFTRSGFGGRFGAMLKFAGWDGLVIEGAADKPVWVDIRDGEVQIHDADTLWGQDTWKTQEAIWQDVGGADGYGDWVAGVDSESGARSTQRPAVLCIGPAGENKCRVASLIHDAGNGAGQGGFGAVWGAKKLKAVSVIGTGHIAVSDPAGLFEARKWALDNYTYSMDELDPAKMMWATMPSNLRSFPVPMIFWARPVQARPQSCTGCQAGCRARNVDGLGNESSCKLTEFYNIPSAKNLSAQLIGSLISSRAGKGKPVDGLEKLHDRLLPTAPKEAADLAQKYGINAGELDFGIPYLRDLNKMGVLGKGRQIDTDLDFDDFGSAEFGRKLLHMIAYREGIGDDMADGFVRAAKNWGRLDEDLKTGVLNYCHWGQAMHYDPRVSLEWGYGTILGDRDINEHGFCPLYMVPLISSMMGGTPLPAEDFAKLFSDKMVPYDDDPAICDYSDANMYSENIAKLVAWHRHYSRFWIQSVLFCDLQYPEFFNWSAKDYKGITGEGEPRFFNAVTGQNLSFADSIELGRRIWNLDNAIWALQGRHRDDVKFADYIYDVDAPKHQAFTMPVRENGTWTYGSVGARSLDRTQFEEFKTRYYRVEGWDTESGWPTRSTLEALGLAGVADELELHDKLGKEKI
ncbi:MAG: aldehyde ferredoxin oxidoreductase, partial [Deltaproteobacteria bacterium]|nr:aldehyde ferredoxin oxidoreductase [Deltaproteobacteria bacterium]